jgi:O-antigen/teichoic acid export membrane protein
MYRFIVKKVRDLIDKDHILMKNFFYFFISSVLSKVINVVVGPFLAYFFSPEDLGYYQIFLSLTSIITGVVCLGYDYPIVLEKENKKAINLLALSLITTLSFSILILIVQILLTVKDVKLIHKYSFLTSKGYLLFFTSLLIGLHQGIYYWCLREKKLLKLSGKNILFNFVALVFPILGSYWYKDFYILIYSTIGAYTVSILYMYISYSKGVLVYIKFINIETIKSVFIRYINFLKINTFISVLNTLNANTIFLITAFLFDFKTTGLISLAYRIAILPAQIFISSISVPFVAYANRMVHVNVNEIKSRFIFLTKILFGVAVFLSLPAFVYPLILEYFLGKQWAMSGVYAQFLTIFMFFQLTFSTLDHLKVYERQKWQMAWEIIRIILSVLVFICAKLLNMTPIAVVLWLSMVNGFSYFLCFLINLRTMNQFIKLREEVIVGH